MSDGRANLHAGGVGIGVDIGTGITTTAIHNNQLIAVHPETAAQLDDLRVPKWRKILEVAVATQRATRLGYTGVDIVLDKHGRVLVLEANARPGLAIQTANLAGLNERVARVRNLKVKSVEHGIRLSAELFSTNAEVTSKTSLKPVLGAVVEVVVTNPTTDQSITVQAKVDTGAASSSLGIIAAASIGYDKIISEFKKQGYFKALPNAKVETAKEKELRDAIMEKYGPGFSRVLIHTASGSSKRIVAPVVITVGGKKITTTVTLAERSKLKYQMLLGAADLRSFYIDLAK